MIYIFFGTRPEIIKLFPVVLELQRRRVPHKNVFTGQHIDLYNDVKALMPPPDILLNTDTSGLSLALSHAKIVSSVESVLAESKAKLVLVQGDTTTACAVSAFYRCVPVAHLEAGLRSDDLGNPFPEEGNRRIISQVATHNFAPTQSAYSRLINEGARGVHITGNTIVDALSFFAVRSMTDSLVVVTIHRRENHSKLDIIFNDLNVSAKICPYLRFVFPMHPNPAVQKYRHLLTAPNIEVIPPQGYPEMLSLISRCRFIISDSGGLQEEAVYFGKKIIIVRKVTERPETIECGLGRLADTNPSRLIDWALSLDVSKPTLNPYGDGRSAHRVVNLLADYI